MVTKKWLEKYEEVKEILAPPVNYAELFAKDEINGKKLFVLQMKEVKFPTGEILVRDPLVWLERKEKPYFIKVPTGDYKIETLVLEIAPDYYRYVATRIKFTDKKPMKYYEALIGNEKLNNLAKGDFFGFTVDAGLATIVDVVTRDKYCDFVDSWMERNPDGNIYDDFFADKFKQNAIENPKFQRSEGDWINFKIPDTDLSVPMIQTGFGDGQYPVYFGYDENGDVCDVVIEYIDVTFEDES